MAQEEDIQDRAEKITEKAIDVCGELKSRKVRSPLDQLALSIFFRHTSYRRSIRALRQLNRAFADWNEVRVSTLEEVVSNLSSSAWAWDSAGTILDVLHELYAKQNQLALNDLLEDRTQTQAREYLRELPGIEREMANEVLMLSYQVPVFPCPDRIARLCHRAGLLEDPRPLARHQRQLTKLFNPEYYAPLHRFLLTSAGKYCKEDEPKCGDCGLDGVCAQVV